MNSKFTSRTFTSQTTDVNKPVWGSHIDIIQSDRVKVDVFKRDEKIIGVSISFIHADFSEEVINFGEFPVVDYEGSRVFNCRHRSETK